MFYLSIRTLAFLPKFTPSICIFIIIKITFCIEYAVKCAVALESVFTCYAAMEIIVIIVIIIKITNLLLTTFSLLLYNLSTRDIIFLEHFDIKIK